MTKARRPGLLLPEAKSRGKSASRGSTVSSPIAVGGGGRSGSGLLPRHFAGVEAVSGGAIIQRLWPGARDADDLNDPFSGETRTYAAMSFIADAVAGVPMRVYATDPKVDDDAETLDPATNEVARLFDKPNPYLSCGELIESTSLQMEHGGGSYWLLLNDRGQQVGSLGAGGAQDKIDLPSEVWPVHQAIVEPRTDPDTHLLQGWKVGTLTGPRDFRASSVVQFKYRHPNGGILGLAPLEVARRRANQIHKGQNYQDTLFDTGGDAGGWIGFEGTPPDEAEKDRVEAQVEEEWDNAARAGGTRVLYGNAKYFPIPTRPKDMQYPELTRVNWDAISEVFRVSPTLLGARAANYAEFLGHLRVFWTIKALPWMNRVTGALNSRFFPRLRNPRWRSYRVAFDLEEVEALQGNLLEQIEVAERLQKLGVPRNRALMMAGIRFEPDDQLGDVALVAAGLERLEDAESEPAPVPAAFGGADDEAADEAADEDGDGADDDDSGSDDASEEERSSATSVVTKEADAGDGGDSADAADREAFEARRAYWKALEDERFKSDKSIRGKTRSWQMRARAAQLKALEEVAESGETKSKPTLRCVWGGRAPSLPSASADRLRTLSFDQVAALTTDEALDLCGLDAVSDRLASFGIERLVDAAWMQKAEISDHEIDALIIVVEDEWQEALAKQLEGAFEETWNRSAEFVARELEAEPLLVGQGRSLQFLEDKLIQVKEGTTSTLARDIRRSIARAIAESETVGTLAQRIHDALPQVQEATRQSFRRAWRRAQTIARTETAQIDNTVREDTFTRNGIGFHEWDTAGDDVVRDTHAELDGQVREIGKPFTTSRGAELLRAADPAGPAGEVINCRCAMRPVIPETLPDDE